MESTEITIIYLNYNGVTSSYNVIPNKIVFESNKWHKTKQWLLHAYDIKNKEDRTFAIFNILAFRAAE